MSEDIFIATSHLISLVPQRVKTWRSMSKDATIIYRVLFDAYSPWKKRGFVYNYKKCPIRETVFKGEMNRIKAHMWKYHIPMDLAPYYCTLCLFRASTRKHLENLALTFKTTHSNVVWIRKYRILPWRWEYFQESVNIYVFSDSDFTRLAWGILVNVAATCNRSIYAREQVYISSVSTCWRG